MDMFSEIKLRPVGEKCPDPVGWDVIPVGEKFFEHLLSWF